MRNLEREYTGQEMAEDLREGIDLYGGEVNLKFVVFAMVKDHLGNERQVSGKEMADICADPDKFGIEEARIVIDVRKVRGIANRMLAELKRVRREHHGTE